jgi:transcriptional regulator with XRE-family HTH domain
MSISPYQCRAARGLFAMTQQELANASGVSLRTITSFEDSSDRRPIAANLAAIRTALKRLGVRFTEAGVEWCPPFSETQIRVIRALQVRRGRSMCSPADLYAESGCSRADLEALVQLRVIDGIDTAPLLTAIGLHVPLLLQAHEEREAQREAARKLVFAPIGYHVDLVERIIFSRSHRRVVLHRGQGHVDRAL